MSAVVYTIGDVPITFLRPLTGGDDAMNFNVLTSAQGTFPTIDPTDVATLEAYAASHVALPWTGPTSPDLLRRYPRDHNEFRRVPWPDDQRRVVWRFERRGAWPARLEAFQADAFQDDAFAPATVLREWYFVEIIDAGAAPVLVSVVTDASWPTLELAWDGVVDGSPTTVINAEPSGWSEVGFDASLWSAGYVPPDPYAGWSTIAGGEFLSSAGRSLGHLNNELWLTRHEFTLAGDAVDDAVLVFNVDNWCRVYLDGVEVASLPTNVSSNWASAHVATIPKASLAAGAHCLGAKVNQDTNSNNWAGNPTMFQAVLAIATEG